MTEFAGHVQDAAKLGDNGFGRGFGRRLLGHDTIKLRSERNFVNVENENRSAQGALMTEKHVTERLRALRKRSEMTMSDLAKALGYAAASSYQRYEDATLTTENGLPLRLTNKIAEVLVGKGTPPITREEVFALSDVDDSVLPRPSGLKFGGVVEAGSFRRSEGMDQDAPTRIIPIAPDPRFPGASQYAFKVVGDSMEKAHIIEGMWVVAVDLYDWERCHGDPEDKTLVIVARAHNGEPERELTVKRLRIFRDRLELRPESNNEIHKPIVFSNPSQESETQSVTILAVLLSAVWLFSHADD